MNQVQMRQSVASGRRVAGAIRSLVNARGLQPECARVLDEILLVPVLTYGSDTMIWKENEKSRIRGVHMDNLRGFLTVKRMDKVPNTRIRELCEVTNGLDERLMKGFFDGSCMWREWKMTGLLRESM